MSDVAWEQLSLTGEHDVATYTRNEVLAINPAHTKNGERVADLHRLGYLPEPVLDPTYGEGSMWTHHRPEILVAHDLNPAKNDGPWPSHDFRDMPYSNGMFPSCLYDPPYRFAGTPTDTEEGGHDDLYGTDVYRTKSEQLALIIDGARECARVTDQFLIVKCQDQVVAGSTFFQTMAVNEHLERVGWVLKDRLHLLSYRPQPAGRSQKNARNNFSTFLVFVPVG